MNTFPCLSFALSTAIRGTILGVQGNATLQEDLVYSVQVKEVYRNSSNSIEVDGTIDIDTGGHTCGVHGLEPGSTYLISGCKYTDIAPIII